MFSLIYVAICNMIVGFFGIGRRLWSFRVGQGWQVRTLMVEKGGGNPGLLGVKRQDIALNLATAEHESATAYFLTQGQKLSTISV